MEGFIAKHPSGNEEWTVKRYASLLTKTFFKSPSPDEPTPLVRITRTTTLIYRQAGTCLAAFHAEKRKAKKKGFHITNINSITEPKRPKVKALTKRVPRKVDVLGHYIPPGGSTMLRTILLLTICLVLSNCEPISSDRSFPFTPLEVTLTAYSPSPAQTQGHPRQMASGKFATQEELREMRYAAVSRDLKEKYDIQWGDKIFLEFEVQDLMSITAAGTKTENAIDLFVETEEIARKIGRQKRRVIIVIQRPPPQS